MTENEIATIVVDSAYHIHNEMGPGLLESVYENCLEYDLKERGLQIWRQVPIKIEYKDIIFEEGFRADLIVEKKLIIEIKSLEVIHPVHKKQLLTYLKLADLRLGLLINFGEALMKTGITRLVNKLPE